jgi:hypothetical protein
MFAEFETNLRRECQLEPINQQLSSLWISRRLKAASACRLRAIAVTSGPNSLSRLANSGLDPTISTSGLSQ